MTNNISQPTWTKFYPAKLVRSDGRFLAVSKGVGMTKRAKLMGLAAQELRRSH